MWYPPAGTQSSANDQRELVEIANAIDAAGLPAYLESTSPKNIPRYERLGFVRIGSIQLPAAGPRVEQMWREPRSTCSASESPARSDAKRQG